MRGRDLRPPREDLRPPARGRDRRDFVRGPFARQSSLTATFSISGTWSGTAVASYLSPEGRRSRYMHTRDPVERVHWQVLWLVSQARGSVDIAPVTGYTLHWTRKLVVR